MFAAGVIHHSFDAMVTNVLELLRVNLEGRSIVKFFITNKRKRRDDRGRERDSIHVGQHEALPVKTNHPRLLHTRGSHVSPFPFDLPNPGETDKTGCWKPFTT